MFTTPSTEKLPPIYAATPTVTDPLNRLHEPPTANPPLMNEDSPEDNVPFNVHASLILMVEPINVSPIMEALLPIYSEPLADILPPKQ
jgi:hypothetical protein